MNLITVKFPGYIALKFIDNMLFNVSSMHKIL
jgi:hypothetical protein